MNWFYSFLFRKALTLVGAYLAAHGIATDAQWQEIVGGITTAIGCILAYFHAQQAAQTKSSLAAQLLRRSSVVLILALAAATLVGCSGMSIVNTDADGSQTSFRTFMPSYPWQDASKAISHATGSATTNGFKFSLVGLDDASSTTSNNVAMVNSVVSAAVTAAIQAATAGAALPAGTQRQP